MGCVFAVVTHGTGLELAGPFLLWYWSRTTIKSFRNATQRGLLNSACLRGWGGEPYSLKSQLEVSGGHMAAKPRHEHTFPKRVSATGSGATQEAEAGGFQV